MNAATNSLIRSGIAQNSVNLGYTMPDFSLPNAVGNTIKLQDLCQMFKWFNSLKIGQKVVFGYGLAIGAIIVGIGTGYRVASFHQHLANVLMEDVLEEILLLNRLENNLLLVHNSQLRILTTSKNSSVDSSESKELLNKIVALQQSWSDFNEEHGTVDVDAPYESLEEKEATDILVKSYQELEPWLLKLEQLVTAQDNQRIVPETMAKNRDLSLEETSQLSLKSLNQFIEAIHDLNQLVVLEHHVAEAQSRQADTWLLYIILASLFLSILIATGLAWSIIRTVVNPLKKLTEFAQEVTQSAQF